MVEPVFEKITFLQALEEKKEQIKVEVKSNLLNEECVSVLSISPFCFVENGESVDGKIKYNGKTNFYITYIDNEGGLKKSECAEGFEGAFELADFEEVKTSINATVEKVEYSQNGAYLTISAVITVCLACQKEKSVSALVGGENLFVDQVENNCLVSLGARKSVYPIEEEFELSYPVEEVLCHNAKAVITATQCGVSSIIVDGEVLLSIVCLQKNEKRDIIKENRVLPFRMEIECEEAMPNMLSVASVKEKSFKIDVGVDEERGVSVVNAFVSLQFEGEAFSQSAYCLAKDAFCTEKHLELVGDNYCSYQKQELRSYNFSVNGKASTMEIPLGATAVACCLEKVNIVHYNRTAEGINLVGEYFTTVYFSDSENKVFARKLEFAFENVIEGEFCENTEFCFRAKAFRTTAKIVSPTELEVCGEVFLTLYPTSKIEHKVVSDIKFLGDKEENTCAISVYIAMANEDAFSLAKRLNQSPDKLRETNKDLQFPLIGNERIVVYRQK